VFPAIETAIKVDILIVFQWVRNSSQATRKKRVDKLSDVVDLIDRFIDDKMLYELEWDDFISWKNPNPFIEGVRTALGEQERYLFSNDKLERKKYLLVLIEQRNKVAAIIGQNPRDLSDAVPG
jgi:hypothetical protein